MPETKVNGKLVSLQNPRVDKLVQEYLAIRNRIHDLEAQFKLFMADYEAKKQQKAALLLDVLKSHGAEMVRTNYGTVSVLQKRTAPLTDPDAFMNFVRDTEMFELLERRANSTAVWDYAQEHNGQLPPGVKLNTKTDVGVRTS
jgi:hypothetical protein